MATTSTPAAAREGLIDQARFRAQTALLGADCKQYLTGPSFQAPDDRDPQQVAGRVPIVSAPVPAGQPAGAIASSPLFRGVRGTISVHPNFFASDPGLPVSPTAAFAPSADQQRTIAILHEIGHLTGREGDHNQDLPRQFEYNATILNLCLARPAVPGPRITGFFCSADELYGHPFNCDLYWEDGTDPDEVQVSSNGSQARRYNDYAHNYVSISGRCDPYQDTYVSISVFDANGRRADATQSGFCPRD
ncbi:hypothetical protein [Actinomadura soli]|uniref:hypothetical protein n=1 Tax=Actinomadura soli TaxID=2508997 RepID=UPI00110A6889|nr:hypothetical protein [Actinomadura soli]